MEIQTTLALFKSSGLALTPECQDRLEQEIVDMVNDAVTKSRAGAVGERTSKGIEARVKSYMRLVAKCMIEEGKRRGLKILDEKVFETARKAVGPPPILD